MLLRFPAFVALVLLGMTAAGEESSAQVTNRAALESLNRDVWHPFVTGIANDDPELYVGVHSADFYWVAPGTRGRIMNYEEYEDDSIAVMAKRKDNGERTEIEFRFLERNVRADFAAEKAIVRAVLHRPGAGAVESYGIAHYFSRREKSGWKMLVQYGSTEKGTAEMFGSAAPIDDIARFQREVH